MFKALKVFQLESIAKFYLLGMEVALTSQQYKIFFNK